MELTIVDESDTGARHRRYTREAVYRFAPRHHTVLKADTCAKYIVQYKNFIPSVGIWRPNQTVLLVYAGSFYVGVNLAQATTSYYGVTKLVNSVTSTATDLAAAAAAVKTAYDRNSWDSISLTNALAIAYGGTGATNAAAARTNLGIYATMLFSGTVTTGSTSFNYGNYNYYVIIGQPSSSGSRTPIIVPKAAITTSAVAYQISDESYYYSFNLYYSGVPAICLQGPKTARANHRRIRRQLRKECT